MAVAIVGTSTLGSTASGTSLTFSHTSPAGADCLLLLAMCDSNSAISGGTWDGNAFTAFTNAGQSNCDGTVAARCLYFPTPTAKTADIVVNLGFGTVPILAYAINLSGVDLAALEDDSDSVCRAGFTTASLTLTSQTDGMVFDILSIGSGSRSATPTGDNTGNELIESGNVGGIELAASWAAGAASVTTSWSTDDFVAMALAAVAIAPAAGGATVQATGTDGLLLGDTGSALVPGSAPQLSQVKIIYGTP